MDTKFKDFESAMTELESIVKTLENGQLTLEHSLEHFERGIALSRYCHKRLEEAEQRVEVLTQSGETTSAPRGLTDTLASSKDSE